MLLTTFYPFIKSQSIVANVEANFKDCIVFVQQKRWKGKKMSRNHSGKEIWTLLNMLKSPSIELIGPCGNYRGGIKKKHDPIKSFVRAAPGRGCNPTVHHSWNLPHQLLLPTAFCWPRLFSKDAMVGIKIKRNVKSDPTTTKIKINKNVCDMMSITTEFKLKPLSF